MKRSLSPFCMLRNVATHRKAWLRMNRIDYSAGKCSERIYKFGNVIINLACGKHKKINPVMYILAVLFILKYVFL